MGYWASKFFTEEGAKLIGVAEFDGSIYNPEGINYQDLKNHLDTHKSIKGFANAEFFEKEDAIYKPWYFYFNSAIFLSQLPWKDQSMRETLQDSSAKLLLRQPTAPLLSKDRKYV